LRARHTRFALNRPDLTLPLAPHAALPSLTVYFDGACPVCTREIATYQRMRGAERCQWVDVTACEPSQLGLGLGRDEALARMHVRRADGGLVSGAAAFAALWQVLPATRTLGRVAGWWPVSVFLELGYRGFLAVRPLWRREVTPVAGTGWQHHRRMAAYLQGELRSDHAGETGAVQIYRGVLAVTRDASLRAFAQRHLEAEQGHLQRLEALQPSVPRSRLLFLWRPAGWLTGAIPALLGPRAVYATIGAVETFVDHHYQQQIDAIDAALRADATDVLPADLALLDLRALLEACRADEVHHRDEALNAQPATGWLARAWGAMVGAGSAWAVVLARRV
jgi:3-demethoxyubiquinol 3-hydroxylase